MTRDVATEPMALHGLADYPSAEIFRFGKIAVVMVEGDVLGAWQVAGIAGGDDRGLHAGRHVHDGWIDVLHVGHPQIERPGAERKLSPHGVARGCTLPRRYMVERPEQQIP